MKKIMLGWLLCPAVGLAADAVRPSEPRAEAELKINVAEPQTQEIPAHVKEAAKPSEKVLQVDEEILLGNTELLERAMYSAVVAQNIAGIKAVLPIYEKWPKHDQSMARYARGLLAQGEGKAGEAVNVYREFIADNPNAPMVRLQLAKALFEDKQNEAAADQFDRLQSEDMPEAVKNEIEAYRKALRDRDSWQFNASLNITREQNINQAPRRRRLGEQLGAEQCAVARQIQSDDDCFRGWIFNAPIDATAVNYQIGTEKKWSLPKGRYATVGAGVYGKVYPNHTTYNDLISRVSAGIGHADQRTDVGVTPFHERRFYGNDPYTYTSGVRLHWNRWHMPKIQTLTAMEFGRLKNTRRADSDNQSRLFSASLVYYANARQYWLTGADWYRERNKNDHSESFDRYGLRVAWGQEWQGGLSSRLQLNAAKRHYHDASFFSNGDKRQDKELGATLSLWHRAVHFKGITPRLTVSHHKNLSNDKFYEYGKSRMFIELGKTF
ncbi:surface lipoprotein assembly modifier [Neisseria yangbaofengii]|uniref:surface lipoprotein assembly modifier n=1 Tax=Neisseria yangbaofengii TaxID=2709396 RepID=UPI0013EAA5A5